MNDWRSHPLFQVYAAVLLAAVAVIWLAGGSYPLIDKIQPLNTRSIGPLMGHQDFEQVVAAPADGLARVDLHIDSRRPEAGTNIFFELATITGHGNAGQPEETQMLRQVKVDSNDINSFEMHRFEFEPVADSGGREYVVRVYSEDVDAGLTIRTSEDDVYPPGKLYVEGEEMPFDLNFALYHDAGGGGLAARVEPFRPPPLNQSWLFLSCLVIGAGAFGWLLWAVASDQR